MRHQTTTSSQTRLYQRSSSAPRFLGVGGSCGVASVAAESCDNKRRKVRKICKHDSDIRWHKMIDVCCKGGRGGGLHCYLQAKSRGDDRIATKLNWTEEEGKWTQCHERECHLIFILETVWSKLELLHKTVSLACCDTTHVAPWHLEGAPALLERRHVGP